MLARRPRQEGSARRPPRRVDRTHPVPPMRRAALRPPPTPVGPSAGDPTFSFLHPDGSHVPPSEPFSARLPTTQGPPTAEPRCSPSPVTSGPFAHKHALPRTCASGRRSRSALQPRRSRLPAWHGRGRAPRRVGVPYPGEPRSVVDGSRRARSPPSPSGPTIRTSLPPDAEEIGATFGAKRTGQGHARPAIPEPPRAASRSRRAPIVLIGAPITPLHLPFPAETTRRRAPRLPRGRAETALARLDRRTRRPGHASVAIVKSASAPAPRAGGGPEPGPPADSPPGATDRVLPEPRNRNRSRRHARRRAGTADRGEGRPRPKETARPRAASRRVLIRTAGPNSRIAGDPAALRGPSPRPRRDQRGGRATELARIDSRTRSPRPRPAPASSRHFDRDQVLLL